MEKKIYYGEYSLKHWINLMITGNIGLPKYQRSFVWEKKDVMRLIQSLQDGQFVQPVTIAHFNSSQTGEYPNIILDGQQRLTSILLAYFNSMPIVSRFEEAVEIAEGDDSANDTDHEAENNINYKKAIKWTFKEIINNTSVSMITKLKEKLQNDDRYERLDIEYKEDIEYFFENTYIGFPYIIPSSNDISASQHFFATLFRNMNYLGRKLSSIESRRSLYYLNKKIEDFFEGKIEDNNVLCDIKIQDNWRACELDFVRYLSILSQYSIHKNENKVLVGYSAYKSRESYYADYVAYLVKLDQESRPDKFNGFDFDSIFNEASWQERFKRLYKFISSHKENFGLSKENTFESWINADYWLFGLLYVILFTNKNINNDNFESLKSEIDEKISSMKKDPYYNRTPNLLKNIRERLSSSIEIYDKYAV